MMGITYGITGEQVRKLGILILNIKENYETKNEIYKILWSVLNSKLPEATIENEKVDLDEMEKLKSTS